MSTPPINKINLVLKLQPGAKLHNGKQFITPGNIAIAEDGTIKEISPNIVLSPDIQIIEIPEDGIVCPGLVDGHAHVAPDSFWGEGLTLEHDFLMQGTVLTIDAGSDGPNTIESDFRDKVINKQDLPNYALAYINIAPDGLKDEKAENYNIDKHDARKTAEMALRYPWIVGIKIRLAWLQAKEGTWKAALRHAKEAATISQKPLMIHIGHGPGILDILKELEDFDQKIIITHCFQGHHSGSIMRCKDDWKKMQDRGVYYDMGNGEGSYSHQTAEEALNAGFNLWSISTDKHKKSKWEMAPSLPHCMSKVLLHGVVKVEDIIKMSTYNPAFLIGQEDNHGSIEVGKQANITVLQHQKSDIPKFRFLDYQQAERFNNEQFRSLFIVRNGNVTQSII